MDFKQYVNDNLNGRYKDILYNDKATPYKSNMTVNDYFTFRDKYRQYKKRLEDEKYTFNQAIDTAKQNKITMEREEKERIRLAQIQKATKRKKRRKAIIVTAISLVLVLAATFGIAYAAIPEFRTQVQSEIKYQNAKSLIKKGEYAEALSVLADVSEHKKANELLSDFTFSLQSTTHRYTFSMPVLGGYGTQSSIKYECENTQTFDSNGNLIKDYTRKWTNDSRVYPISSRSSSYSTEYSYDEHGWLISEKDISSSGTETITEYKNTYDDNGNCVRVECIRPDGTSTFTNYTYDGASYTKKVVVSSENETTTTEYFYDDYERCIKEIVTDSNNETKTWTYTYNQFGSCVLTVCADAQGNEISTSEVEYSYSFSYNEEGKLICTEKTDDKTKEYLVIYSEK